MDDKPYAGRILWVDLTRGSYRRQELPDSFYQAYLGGMGLAAAVLQEAIPPDADPLGSENVLAFVPGLLTGTPSLFTGRWLVAAKSPLTKTWGDANCGGSFALAIKQCGLDGIFIRGQSERPVALYLDHNRVELRDASSVWGMDTVTCERTLAGTVTRRKSPSIACIGPAGERQSWISGIVNEGGRIAARSGLGAVMGAKRLKALVLAGSKPVSCAHPERMKTLSRVCARHVRRQHPLPGSRILPFLGALLRLFPASVRLDGALLLPVLARWGTTGMSEASVQWGDAPVRNWAGSERDYPLRMSASIDPGRLQAQEEFRYHCVACPLGCGSLLRREEELEHKPEYETVASLSALMLNTDLNAVFAANDLLNRAGMDTISAGGTIAWAMECRERGVLTQTDLDGIDLRWGDGPAIVALVRKMIAREGIGDLLANGSAEAARKVGGGSEAWTVQAGGQELALHDPRLDPGLALHAVVDPTPGRHTQGGWIYYDSYQLWRKLPELPRPPLFSTKSSRFLPSAENGQKAAAVSRYHQLINSAGVCMFGAYLGVHRFPLFEWLNAATGWDRSPAEYMEVGNQIQALRQRFNLQQGIDPRRVEIAPRAVGHPPQTVGANRGRSIPMAKMVRAYWQAIGWDAQTGEPPVLPDSESHPSFKESISPWLPVTPDSTWDRVPGSAGKSPRRLAKQPQIDLVRCVCCRLCVLTCPTHALDVLPAHPQRRHRPAGLVRETDCIGCGFCERVCPMEAIVMQRGKSESGESSV